MVVIAINNNSLILNIFMSLLAQYTEHHFNKYNIYNFQTFYNVDADRPLIKVDSVLKITLSLYKQIFQIIIIFGFAPNIL